MRIGLVVDHPKRDLPGAVMLGYQLARRGASVVLVPMYEQAVDVPRLGLDALVVNYARPVNLDLMRSFAKAGLALYVLDTEGGVLAEKGGNSPPAMAAHVKDSGYADILAGYFFWGSRLYDAFLAAGTMPPEQLHLTGCPRFDFAASRWRALLDGEPRGYLLVNANFPLVNSRFTGKPGGEREAMVRSGWNGDYVDRFIADLKQVFTNYLSGIERLAAARPDRKILVRPHPFESEDVYRNALSHEMDLRGIPHAPEAKVPIHYKGKQVGDGSVDILVAGRLVLELKVVEALNDIHRSQVISYLRALRLQLGLLLNFNVDVMRDGIRRVVVSIH